eukprot:c30461_g1_i1.p1 GENE.c30461_g1_i1~~c30461_g1_i1.p1  ORF type:complete len:241 (-),score=70.73 c30461_g1_i1:32-754(-)
MDFSTEEAIEMVNLILSSLCKNNNHMSFRVFPNRTQNPSRFLFTIAETKNIAPLENFFQRFHAETDSPSTIYIYALCLLQKLELTKAFTKITARTAQAIFSTCFSLSSKYLEDIVFSDLDFADIVGTTLDQQIAREIHYLTALGFNVTVTQQEIDTMSQRLAFIWSSRSSISVSKMLASCTGLNEIMENVTSTLSANPIRKIGSRIRKMTSYQPIFHERRLISRKTKSLNLSPIQDDFDF